MAFSEALAGRIRQALARRKNVEENEFHQQLAPKNYKYLRPGIETTFYDSKCVRVIDPFGNRIRFNEDLKAAKTT